MSEIPVVRLSIERMQCQILTALTDYSHKIDEAIKEEVERVVNNFDFESEIRADIQRILPRVLQETIEQAARSAVENYDLWKKMKDAVLKTIMEELVREGAQDG